jgi:exodeoxyribonuclease VII large subunit
MAVYSVSQLTGHLAEMLRRDSILQDVWVRGEVSNLARPGSGNFYYTLRDSQASLRCVMFGRSSRGADLLSDGSAVIAHGKVSLYQVRGDLQLIADIVQAEGVGELQLRLEQLRLKLETEGLFEVSRKRPIPRFPQKIGVVTSPSGAVWQDIQNVVGRRYPLVELALAPVAVQGEEAVPSIVEALAAMSDEPGIDVVVLARGGGSLEDLWAFNEEAVARAIFASGPPVISAVGHETDYTIADLVADVRAPTPSAAAELAVPDATELSAGLLASRQALTGLVSGALRSRQDEVERIRPQLRRARPDLDSMRLHIDDLLTALVAGLRRDVKARSERSSGLAMRLKSLSPLDTLRRGYAIVHAQDGTAVVSDSAQVGAGDHVDVTLARGGFEAEVIETQTPDGADGAGA